MTIHRQIYPVYIEKPRPEAHQLIVDWCTETIGSGNFTALSWKTDVIRGHSIFHFYDKESALAFSLKYDGKVISQLANPSMTK